MDTKSINTFCNPIMSACVTSMADKNWLLDLGFRLQEITFF